MYPKNAATPPTIAIGEVHLIADGSVVTSGASARVITAGGSWGAAAGTLACDSTSGCWTYAPTQGETNGTWFIVAVYKASCHGCQQTVITTATAVAGTVDVGAISGDATAADNLEAAYDGTGYLPLYHADIHLSVDAANSQDEYTVQWYKNGVPLTSGVTSAQIQVVKRADGTDLIAATNMTQIASLSRWKYDATTTARITAGEAVLVIVTASIDSATRTWARIIGRDSTA